MTQPGIPANDAVRIEEATETDYPAIYEINAYYIEQTDNNWNHRPRPFGRFAANLETIRRKGRPAIVARLNNSVVGYGTLHEFRSADGYWPCVENSIYVHPDHQKKGIGKMLMKALIEQAQATGCWSIIAVADAGNQDSIVFHERFGFKECGRINQIGEKNHRALSVVYLQLDIPENRNRFLEQTDGRDQSLEKHSEGVILG